MRRCKAFTLIELLVVVAIIAALIAILLPALGKAKERTRQVTCATNLHGYGIALQSYYTEYNRIMTSLRNPFGGSTPSAFWIYNNNGDQISLEALSPYLKGVAGLDPNKTDFSKVTITKIWFCPSQGVGQPNTSPDTLQWHWFTMNYTYFGGFDADPLRGMATKPQNLLGSDFLLPDSIVMEDDFFRWANPPSGGPRWDINHGAGGSTAQHLNGPFVTGRPPFSGNNVLFSDFSVRFKGFGEYLSAPLLDASPSSAPHVDGGGGDQTFY